MVERNSFGPALFGHGFWKPNMGMLMHVACFDDRGADLSLIDEKKRIAAEDGWLVLRHAKLRITVSVEYPD